MDTIRLMNDAMHYIEKNLDNEIDYNIIFKLAGCSEYHFRRMFPYLTGMSLGEYIRKRKLSQAGILLRDKKNKVIDIAIRFGYDSPDSFTRAFYSFHGITASEARNQNMQIKVCTPIFFQFKMKGANIMNYRIIEKEAFKIIGVSGKLPIIYNGPNPHSANVWKKLTQRDILILLYYSNTNPKGMLNVYANYQEGRAEGSEVDYYVGVAVEQNFEPFVSHFDVLHVEASQWAIFTTIEQYHYETQTTWDKIFSEWFSTSGYEHTGGPELLWYESYENEKPNRKTEIWIPIKQLKNK